MTGKEIIKILSETVGYKNDGTFVLGNFISSFDKKTLESLHANPDIYHNELYPKMKKAVESLPWISVHDYMPDMEGKYLTLLDCNEHEVDCNTYKDRYWHWCHRHVCYWMPIPEDTDEEIDWRPSVMDWHDGGQH